MGRTSVLHPHRNSVDTPKICMVVVLRIVIVRFLHLPRKLSSCASGTRPTSRHPSRFQYPGAGYPVCGCDIRMGGGDAGYRGWENDREGIQGRKGILHLDERGRPNWVWLCRIVASLCIMYFTAAISSTGIMIQTLETLEPQVHLRELPHESRDG